MSLIEISGIRGILRSDARRLLSENDNHVGRTLNRIKAMQQPKEELKQKRRDRPASAQRQLSARIPRPPPASGPSPPARDTEMDALNSLMAKLSEGGATRKVMRSQARRALSEVGNDVDRAFRRISAEQKPADPPKRSKNESKPKPKRQAERLANESIASSLTPIAIPELPPIIRYSKNPVLPPGPPPLSAEDRQPISRCIKALSGDYTSNHRLRLLQEMCNGTRLPRSINRSQAAALLRTFDNPLRRAQGLEILSQRLTPDAAALQEDLNSAQWTIEISALCGDPQDTRIQRGELSSSLR